MDEPWRNVVDDLGGGCRKTRFSNAVCQEKQEVEFRQHGADAFSNTPRQRLHLYDLARTGLVAKNQGRAGILVNVEADPAATNHLVESQCAFVMYMELTRPSSTLMRVLSS